MSIESELLECMLKIGLSDHSARFHACDIAARIAPTLERERLEHACRDLFYSKSRADLAKEYRVHRSTIYRVHEKLVASIKDETTKVA